MLPARQKRYARVGGAGTTPCQPSISRGLAAPLPVQSPQHGISRDPGFTPSCLPLRIPGRHPSSGPSLKHSPCSLCPTVRLGSGLAPCSMEFKAIHSLGRRGRGRQVTSLGGGARLQPVVLTESPGSNLLWTGTGMRVGTSTGILGTVCRTHTASAQ